MCVSPNVVWKGVTHCQSCDFAAHLALPAFIHNLWGEGRNEKNGTCLAKLAWSSGVSKRIAYLGRSLLSVANSRNSLIKLKRNF